MLTRQINLQRMIGVATSEVKIWEDVESAVLFVIQTNAGPELQKRLTARIQMQVGALLSQYNDSDRELQELLRRHHMISPTIIFNNELGIAYQGINPRLVAQLQQFADAPLDVARLGVTTWSTDLQMLFLSGKYVMPLKQFLTELQGALKHSNLRFSILTILMLLAFIGVAYWWWKFYIDRSFSQLEKQRHQLNEVVGALSASNDQLKTAFNSLQDAACMTDKNGTLKLMNGPFNELFMASLDGAVTLQQVVGSVPPYARMSEPVSQLEMEDFVEFLRNSSQFVYRGKDLQWSFSPLLSGGWLVVIYDYTELQEQKAHALQTQRFEVMGRLSRSVAHDFNNILASIMGKAEMIGLESTPGKKTSADIKTIVDYCIRGRALTSQLLTYAKQQPMKMQMWAVNDLIKSLVSQLSLPRNITLKVRNQSSCEISVDQAYFINALGNIVQNSIEAIGDAEGEITISARDHLVSGSALQSIIEVRDTGPGYSPDAIRFAKDPFFSTKYEKNGTGLGLAMVDGFVAQCDGELLISNVEEGACSALVFPSFRPAEVVSLSDIQEKADIKIVGHENCLLIEDDPNVRTLMERFLNRYFDHVYVACDQASALTTLTEIPDLDAALCDWMLPDGNSEPALVDIRKRFPNATVVVFTGLLEDKTQTLAQDLRIEVLNKPVSLNKLIEIMRLSERRTKPGECRQSKPA